MTTAASHRARPAMRYVGVHRAPASRAPAARDRSRERAALVAGTLCLVAVAAVLRAQVAGPVSVASDSMEPTLHRGDVVLVRHGPVDVGALRRGDLVTFASPQDGAETLKRVVGLPGEDVSLRDSLLVVDERQVPEPYVDYTHNDAEYTATVTVPSGAVLLLGDNRGASIDSRDYGPVPGSALTGRVLARVWPPVRLGGDDPAPPRP